MLEISNLSFSLGQTQILDQISFKVNKQERLGLIGPNGSGKTTLFNCISGFHLPQSGKITFNSNNITTKPAYQRASLGLGRVFQNFGIFREMTVLENLLTAIETKDKSFSLPWSKSHRLHIEQAMSYLASIKLDSDKNKKAGTLSGGQMRLLEIVRTLASGAQMFLLDEPTAGVSPKMKGEIEKMLLHLHEEGKTLLIIEHDLNFIQRICSRIIVLDVGKVLIDDTSENVRNDPRLQEIYFGSAAP